MVKGLSHTRRGDSIHIKLCKRNLRNKRVKCCAICPFEEEILAHYPELAEGFRAKRKMGGGGG